MIGLLHFVTDLISMKTLPNYIITSSQNITASIYFQTSYHDYHSTQLNKLVTRNME